MRILIVTLIFLNLCAYAQTDKKKNSDTPIQEVKSEKQIVEAGCGMCMFGMEGTGCKLAVMIDGEAYLVDGADLHDQGDAHAHNGMCNVVRKAEVEGEVVKGRFKASSFALLPDEEDKE